MYRKIMVPLDGSKLAECVLPHVEDLAKGCSTEEVILVSVTERIVGTKRLAVYRQPGGPLPPHEPITTVPVAVGKKQRQAERYLGRIAKRLAKKAINVRTEVLLGNPAPEIVDCAEHNDCDLIAIASHGRSGITVWAHSIGAYGGVADKVLRASSIPVLMVKATQSESSTQWNSSGHQSRRAI